MVKLQGGRGKKAPYEQTHLRVPLPVKDRVQAIIDSYRNFVTGKDYAEIEPTEDVEEVAIALRLLRRFIDDAVDEDSYDKPTRDNKNLKRFEGWLIDQL